MTSIYSYAFILQVRSNKTTKARLISKKRPTTSSRRAVFGLKTPKRPQQKTVETTKIIQKRNVLRTKPWWDGYHPTYHPTISNHQPSTHENTPCDPAPPQDTPTGRNLMTRHDGDFLTTRSGSLKKM